jgi:hypothetical protein
MYQEVFGIGINGQSYVNSLTFFGKFDKGRGVCFSQVFKSSFTFANFPSQPECRNFRIGLKDCPRKSTLIYISFHL